MTVVDMKDSSVAAAVDPEARENDE